MNKNNNEQKQYIEQVKESHGVQIEWMSDVLGKTYKQGFVDTGRQKIKDSGKYRR